MQKSSLPSKQFLIRGGIATVIVAIILIVQTEWFLALFNKKPKQIDPNLTIGDAIAKDSNSNGIPDWEERLWGLDPTELYTGDMSNKEIIDNKKRALGLTIEGEEDLNETDRLARQLFSISASLGQEGASLDDMGNAGAALGNSIEVAYVGNHYSRSDLKTTSTTAAALRAYQQKSSTILKKYAVAQTDFNSIIAAVETGDYSNLSGLTVTAVNYRTISKELAAIPTPIGIAQYHLDIINGLYGMAESFQYIVQLESNAVVGLNGLAIYKEYSTKLDLAALDLNYFLTDYGIL